MDEFPFLGRDEHRAVGMVSGGQILPAFPPMHSLASWGGRSALAGGQRLLVGVGILFGPVAFALAISLNRFLKAKIDCFYALTAAGKTSGVAIDRRLGALEVHSIRIGKNLL